MKRLFITILVLSLFTACERKIDEFVPDTNTLNFNKFVAVGGSYSAGYADGALYKTGQENCIPNIIAEQFKLAGGGKFNQPYLKGDKYANGVGVQPKTDGSLYFHTELSLQFVKDLTCAGTPLTTSSLKSIYTVDDPDQAQLYALLVTRLDSIGPYNNMGVPWIRINDLYKDALQLNNPYFTRFSASSASSIMKDALAQQPTFFMFWAGDNDALMPALAGTDQGITKVDTFQFYYNRAVDNLLASGSSPKGVLVTIPDITSIPFFTTISKQLPYNGVELVRQGQADKLNALYNSYEHPEIVWKVGLNPFVIIKEDGSLGQMDQDDIFLLTLPTDSIKCRGMGMGDTIEDKLYPIPRQFVLQLSAKDNIQDMIVKYNEIITKLAGEKSLALADLNAFMKTLESGMVFDGIKMNTTYISGGMFSTDGIHLNPLGNAVVANYIIRAINAKYECKIPQANITEYPGLWFP